ncbi:MAG TPA: lytic transglycosylase domain-containing protein [Pyrinomonadaceae bacterium]|jgi:soluble lytic murein transglycosylase-like protein
MNIRRRIVGQVALVAVFVMRVQGQKSFEAARVRARSVEPIISEAAARYGVDPRVLWTIGYLESRFNSNAISYKNGEPCAFGLMQFLPSTGKRYGLRNPHDPQNAIDAAARYLRELMARFDGRLELVLAAYNAGEGAVEAYRYGRRLMLPNGKVINPRGISTGGIPPYRETRGYVARGRLIFSAITRKQLFLGSPRQGAETSAKGSNLLREASIYTSNYGSRSLTPNTLSLYSSEP